MKITVIGSINVDTTLRVNEHAKIGETIQINEQLTSGGGKGANQAVAAARSGADVSFIGTIGNDYEGRMMLDFLTDEAIQCAGIDFVNAPTGHAFISVNQAGDNFIMIDPGANQYVTSQYVEEKHSLIEQSDIIIGQLECNDEGTLTAFQIAKESDTVTILNPAPAKEISNELLALTDIIIPNETEAEALLGITITDEDSLTQIADYFHQQGVPCVIITLGDAGAFYDYQGKQMIIPAYSVDAVDTTAAGDTFIGAFATRLSKNFLNLGAAINYANCASSLAVQVIGAQPYIPDEEMVLQHLR